jgi:ABC-type multidrug transport system ATPase subunit
MDISIKNVGVISQARLSITKDKLNIKYGINGVGKTTIAKAIYYKLEEDKNLEQLIKYGTHTQPEVDIPESIKSAIYFDKNYVDRFLFNEDLVNNSYEIIVKNERFDQMVKSVEQRLENIRRLASNYSLNLFTDRMNEFGNSFPLTPNNEIRKGAKAKLINGLKNGDLIQKINCELEKYRNLLTSANSFEWSKWFASGESFINDGDNNCPYCRAPLSSDFSNIKERLKSTFDSNKIKENFASKQQLSNLMNYSSKEEKALLTQVVSNSNGPSNEQLESIKIIYLGLYKEKEKISNLKDMSAITLSNKVRDDSLEIFLRSNRLNQTIYNNFDTIVQENINEINDKIDELLTSINEFKQELGRLQSEMVNSIRKTKINVNDFLKISGIPYEISISDVINNSCRTYLKPINVNITINDPKNKLSFGEQNAISLILFSLDAIAKNKDLIILDDPVSSFDDSKKYAIIHHLFKSNGQNNFYGKTVLMFTHDFSPIIDFIYNGKPNRGFASAHYISNKGEVIYEKEIRKEDIQLILTIEHSAASNTNYNIITRLVHLRRYYEIKTDNFLEYNMISSLLHLRRTPYIKSTDGTEVAMNNEQINQAENQIRKDMEYDSFNYTDVLNIIDNNEFLVQLFSNSNDVDKLNITRILIERNNINHNNEVLWKYLCESYHIENNYLFFLNVDGYDLIPEYILKECENIVSTKVLSTSYI